jgi:hypothetical protein
MRVASHRIEVISTHRKIGHFTSIKWYQLSRLIDEFYLVFSPSYSPQKPNKNLFQVRYLPHQPFSLAHSFNKCLCRICVLTHSFVSGYLYFLPFVPSFLITQVRCHFCTLLIHPPPCRTPRAHTHRAAASRSLLPFPWCGRSKNNKK